MIRNNYNTITYNHIKKVSKTVDCILVRSFEPQDENWTRVAGPQQAPSIRKQGSNSIDRHKIQDPGFVTALHML